MFTWNHEEQKRPPTDEEIAFEITDCLFGGQDVRIVEKKVLTALRNSRVETLAFLIDECHDKVLELRIDGDSEAVNKLYKVISIMTKYKADLEKGRSLEPRLHPLDTSDDGAWTVTLSCVILFIWFFFWILR